MGTAPSTLLITCGALAREVVELIRLNHWTHMTVACLPADWHNTPDRIPEAVRGKIRAARNQFEQILVLYGDCGTGGILDQVLEEEGVARIPGPHCYAFYAGLDAFDGLMEEEPGSLFLTDFLVRHFDRLIIQGLGLDRFPQLRDDYFGNYRRVVFLAQTRDEALQISAQAAAERLGLEYQYRFTGYGGLASFMDVNPHGGTVGHGDRDNRLLA